MDHVKVDMIEPELAHAALERAMERVRCKLVVPNLGSDEEFIAVHAGGCDGRSDLCFILVHRGGSDMPIAERDRALDDWLGVGSRHAECAEAETGNRDALCGDGLHDAFLSWMPAAHWGAAGLSQSRASQAVALAWLVLTSSAMTLSSVVVPLTANRPLSRKAIQPSLKPSSIVIRGSGLRAP